MYLINPKYTRTGDSSYQNNGDITIVHRGKVVSTYDPNDAGRIKVRVMGVDNNDKDDKIFYAFPMLPKYINIVPNKEEAVLIFTFNTGNNKVDRMYMGPIIPQPQHLDGADYDINAWDGFSFARNDLGPAITNMPKIKGSYPKQENIAIQGRKNVDVILKDSELLLRAGKFVSSGDLANDSRSDDEFVSLSGGKKIKFNTKTQGYIQIKYNEQTNVTLEGGSKEYGTVTNIVANKINLLTHKEGSPRFNLTNQDNLISDEEMQKILSEAHPLVFGDKLVEFLKLVKNAIANHTHKYPGITPHTEGSSATAKVMQDMNRYNLDQILSKNIRIN